MGCEDAALLALYRRLGQLRRGRTSLQSGSIAYLAAEGGVLAILRQSGAERTLTALNAGDTPAELALPWADTVARSALDGQEFFVPDGVLRLTLPPGQRDDLDLNLLRNKGHVSRETCPCFLFPTVSRETQKSSNSENFLLKPTSVVLYYIIMTTDTERE